MTVLPDLQCGNKYDLNLFSIGWREVRGGHAVKKWHDRAALGNWAGVRVRDMFLEILFGSAGIVTVLLDLQFGDTFD